MRIKILKSFTYIAIKYTADITNPDILDHNVQKYAILLLNYCSRHTIPTWTAHEFNILFARAYTQPLHQLYNVIQVSSVVILLYLSEISGKGTFPLNRHSPRNLYSAFTRILNTCPTDHHSYYCVSVK